MDEPNIEHRGRSAFALDAVGQRAKAAAKAAWWGAAGGLARAITRPTQGEAASSFQPQGAPVSKERLRRVYLEAFEKDARDVAAGLYPAVEDAPTRPIKSILRALDFLVDARAVDLRRRRGDGVEVRGDPKPKPIQITIVRTSTTNRADGSPPRALDATTLRSRRCSPARLGPCVVEAWPCWPSTGGDAISAT